VLYVSVKITGSLTGSKSKLKMIINCPQITGILAETWCSDTFCKIQMLR
jgi:hypothetical protein